MAIIWGCLIFFLKTFCPEMPEEKLLQKQFLGFKPKYRIDNFISYPIQIIS